MTVSDWCCPGLSAVNEFAVVRPSEPSPVVFVNTQVAFLSIGGNYFHQVTAMVSTGAGVFQQGGLRGCRTCDTLWQTASALQWDVGFSTSPCSWEIFEFMLLRIYVWPHNIREYVIVTEVDRLGIFWGRTASYTDNFEQTYVVAQIAREARSVPCFCSCLSSADIFFLASNCRI